MLDKYEDLKGMLSNLRDGTINLSEYLHSASRLISFNVIVSTDRDESTETTLLNVRLFNVNDTTQVE
jgi:hypothetical protein